MLLQSGACDSEGSGDELTTPNDGLGTPTVSASTFELFSAPDDPRLIRGALLDGPMQVAVGSAWLRVQFSPFRQSPQS